MYRQIEEEARELGKSREAYRRAFATHLEMVAEVLRLIESVDSKDYAPGVEKSLILSCINPGMVFTTLIEEAVKIRDELTEMLIKTKR